MSDGNETARRAANSTGQGEHERERTTQPYHDRKWSATTARAENSLAGRSARTDLKSRPVVTNRAQRSHSATLIAIAAGIAARMVR